MAAMAAELANAAKTAVEREAKLSALTQLYDLLLHKARAPRACGRPSERRACAREMARASERARGERRERVRES